VAICAAAISLLSFRGLDKTIAELRIQTQREKRESDSLSAELIAMGGKLKGAQIALD
jgi:hypothetical protein